MPSLLYTLFGFGKEKYPTLLVIHDEFIQAVQLNLTGGQPQLMGFNEADLEEGVVQKGDIKNLTRLEEICMTLFKEVKPAPITPKWMLINIPFWQTFAFAKDFSHHVAPKHAQKEMEEFISKNSPIAFEELSIYHQEHEEGHGLTHGAIAVVKRWEESISKLLKRIGVRSLSFISQADAHLALLPEEIKKNLACFFWQKNKIFSSFFENGVLFDSYVCESGWQDCLKEFRKAAETFDYEFHDKIQHLHFTGFPQSDQKEMEKSLSVLNIEYDFTDRERSEWDSLIQTQHDKTVLLGLLAKLLEKKQ